MTELNNIEDKLAFKQKIKEACAQIIGKRIETARAAMQQAQESANSDEKSSAGDKHETSRAMGHLDSEMNARQLSQALHDLETLHKLNTSTILTKAAPGTVIITTGNDVFFIGAGLGVISIDNNEVIVLSPAAPLAIQLASKKEGDTFSFKGKSTSIKSIF